MKIHQSLPKKLQPNKPEIPALLGQGENYCLFPVKNSSPVEWVFLWPVNGC